MGFKNFDKPDDEKVEKVEKPDAKDDGEKEKIGDKIKGFFDKMKAGKEGKEEKEENKENKEGKESKEDDKNKEDEKAKEDRKNSFGFTPFEDLSPQEQKDYLKKQGQDAKERNSQAEAKKDAGNNSDDNADKDEKVRERNDDLER